MPSPAIEIRDLVKEYRGLRPLRVRHLAVERGELVAVSGPDAVQASVLVDLITGATLPESGEIAIDGVSTASLTTQEAWLAFLDQFGIVNSRVVLLDSLSVAQNLAVPLTLSVDPLPAEIRTRVGAIALAVGLAPDLLDAPVGSIAADDRLRVKLGRAIALAPRTLLVEHPTLDLEPGQVRSAVRKLAALARPDVAILVVTADAEVTRVATRALSWQPGTGILRETPGWRRWLGR